MSIFKKENGALVEYTNPLPADYVAPIEDGATSAHNYAVGAFALVKGVLRKITTAVTRGTAITNANSEITTVAKQLEEINTDLSELSNSERILYSATNGSWQTIALSSSLTNFRYLYIDVISNDNFHASCFVPRALFGNYTTSSPLTLVKYNAQDAYFIGYSSNTAISVNASSGSTITVYGIK